MSKKGRWILNLFKDHPSVQANVAFMAALRAALASGFKPDMSAQPVVSLYYDGQPRLARVEGTFIGALSGKSTRGILKLRHDPRQRLHNPAELLIAARHWLADREQYGIVAPQLLSHAVQDGTDTAWPWTIEEHLGKVMQDYTWTEGDRGAFVQAVLQLQEALKGFPPPRAPAENELSAVALHTGRMRHWANMCTANEGGALVQEYFDADTQAAIHDRVIAWYGQDDRARMHWEHGAVSPRRFVPLTPDATGKPRWGVLSWEHLAPRPVGYTAAYVIWVCAIMHPSWQARTDDVLLVDVPHWINRMANHHHPFGITGTYDERRLWLRIALLERCYGTIMADIGAQRQMPIEEKRARLASLVGLVEWLLNTTK